MVWFFEMPFEFDNVPLASLQIISLTPPSPPPLQLFTIANAKDALCCIQATALQTASVSLNTVIKLAETRFMR